MVIATSGKSFAADCKELLESTREPIVLHLNITVGPFGSMKQSPDEASISLPIYIQTIDDHDAPIGTLIGVCTIHVLIASEYP